MQDSNPAQSTNIVIIRGGIRNLGEQEHSNLSDLINRTKYTPIYDTILHHLNKVDERWSAGELSREINSQEDMGKIQRTRQLLQDFRETAIEKKMWFDSVTEPGSTWDIGVQDLKFYLFRLAEISRQSYKLKLKLQDSLDCNTDEMKRLFREYRQRR